MTIEDTRNQILTDDEFVLSEMDKLRYLYALKNEIRWDRKREEVVATESVAEHIYGMHVLANYFMAIEDIDDQWNKQSILEMVTWHDIDEVETGDTISYMKNVTHEEASRLAWPKVIKNLPTTIQVNVSRLIDEYLAQETPEAKFVKAIDKLEPIIEEQSDHYKTILRDNNNTLEQHWRPRKHYLEKFPYIWRFAQVGTNLLEKNGFFESKA